MRAESTASGQPRDDVRRMGLTEHELTAVVVSTGRRGIDWATVRVTAVPYAFATPATESLNRVSGRDADGEPWSLFCKTIQHPRRWSGFAQLPEDIAQRLATVYPWRQELTLWDAAFLTTMPAAIRAPQLHRVVDLGEDRVAIWMEDVKPLAATWDLGRYAAAATALGRWNQRARDPELLHAMGREAHFPLKTFSSSVLRARGFAPLADDELWAHPALAAQTELRQELLRLAGDLVKLIEDLDDMALCRPHGDACPQNLLVPSEAPDTFVAIDISQQGPTALGCDLAQLAVGLIHAGEQSAEMLVPILDTVVPAYVIGLRDEGWDGSEEDISRAVWTALLVRSGFDTIPYVELRMNRGDESENTRNRIALTRVIADGAARHLAA